MASNSDEDEPGIESAPMTDMPMTDMPMTDVHGEHGTSNRNESANNVEQRLKWWRIAVLIFVMISAILFATVIVLAAIGGGVQSSNARSGNDEVKEKQDSQECSTIPISYEKLRLETKLFGGLTPSETDEVVKFMMSQKELDLKKATVAKLDENYIYSIEDDLPPKSEVLDWLDGKRQSHPERKARVLLFLGKTRTIREYLVSPIPKPRRKVTDISETSDRLTWKARPVCNIVEMPVVYNYIIEQLKTISPVFEHSFAPGCVDIEACAYMNIAPRVVIGSPDRHVITWFFISPFQIEDYYVYPLPFYIILKTPGNGINYEIVKIFYNGKAYNSTSDLKEAYDSDAGIRYMLPDLDKERGLYGSPQRTEQENTNDQQRRPPQQYYPDGPRFAVNGSTVEWLEWSFDIHPRTVSGMQLFNVQYKNERIAYELSMQDIIVMYSGGPPDDYFKNYVDIGWSIGTYNMPLIRGVDCPMDSVYLNSNVYSVGEDKGIVMQDAKCIFEHRNSIPLRRHYSADFYEWGYRYAFSMPDTVLVVRQIITVWNYDYIFDYEFHQNGVIEVKVSSTGYVAVTNNLDGSSIAHGYILNEHWRTTGNLHQHLFNFKLDLDIGGRNNNFKTININDKNQTTEFSGEEHWHQMFMTETVINSEQEAAIRYHFEKPKLYVMYDNSKTKQRGYRIHTNNFNFVTLPEDSPFKKGGASWSKYQLAITKFSDSERTTASQFVQGDPFNAAINFDRFIANNDNINNEDLVAWVTVGLHHIPSYEDLPVTTTSGKTLVISIAPYNYFKRDPSMNSRDAAVFWNKSFNKTDDYFHRDEDRCLPHHYLPEIHN